MQAGGSPQGGFSFLRPAGPPQHSIRFRLCGTALARVVVFHILSRAGILDLVVTEKSGHKIAEFLAKSNARGKMAVASKTGPDCRGPNNSEPPSMSLLLNSPVVDTAELG